MVEVIETPVALLKLKSEATFKLVEVASVTIILVAEKLVPVALTKVNGPVTFKLVPVAETNES